MCTVADVVKHCSHKSTLTKRGTSLKKCFCLVHENVLCFCKGLDLTASVECVFVFLECGCSEEMLLKRFFFKKEIVVIIKKWCHKSRGRGDLSTKRNFLEILQRALIFFSNALDLRVGA